MAQGGRPRVSKLFSEPIIFQIYHFKPRSWRRSSIYGQIKMFCCILSARSDTIGYSWTFSFYALFLNTRLQGKGCEIWLDLRFLYWQKQSITALKTLLEVQTGNRIK